VLLIYYIYFSYLKKIENVIFNIVFESQLKLINNSVSPKYNFHNSFKFWNYLLKNHKKINFKALLSTIYL